MTGGLYRNRGGVTPHRIGARSDWFIPVVLAATVWLTSSASVQAQAPDRRDIHLAMKSRQALQKDRDIAELRLTVQVQRGVATIWGPVPSDTFARRAKKLVEQVPGIYEVRTDCYAMTPVLKAPIPVDWPQPQALPNQAIARAIPATGTGADDAWDGVHVVTRHKVEMLPDPEPFAPQREGRPAIALMAPIALPVPPTPVRPDLWIRVEKVCNSDPAYRNIKIDVSDGVVTLTGRVARIEQRMALAQAIARMPGVERVSVREVEVGR